MINNLTRNKKILMLLASVMLIGALAYIYHNLDILGYLKTKEKKTDIAGYSLESSDFSSLIPEYDPSKVKPLKGKLLTTNTSKVSMTNPKGRLVIPSANINLKIYEGLNNENLLLGVGEQLPRSYIKAGEPGNYILAGHRYMYKDEYLLGSLSKARVGDLVYVTDQNYMYTYRVHTMVKVDKSDTRLLEDTDVPTITIYTCVSLRRNEGKRYVLQGGLIDKSDVSEIKKVLK